MSEDKTVHFCETIEAVTTATEELRRLLDERGIEYCDYYRDLTYFRIIPDVEDDFFTTVEETRTHRLILKVGFKSPKQAVDAIQAIKNTLGAGTCRNVHEPPKDTTFWPSPHFKCSECGATHVSMGYVYYCPNCGRKVVDE